MRRGGFFFEEGEEGGCEAGFSGDVYLLIFNPGVKQKI